MQRVDMRAFRVVARALAHAGQSHCSASGGIVGDRRLCPWFLRTRKTDAEPDPQDQDPGVYTCKVPQCGEVGFAGCGVEKGGDDDGEGQVEERPDGHSAGDECSVVYRGRRQW